MRIVSWNVNGLRSALSKGAWDWLSSQPWDVLCLQEIRAREEQLTAAQQNTLGKYWPVWHPAQRAGYSGVATFTVRPAEVKQVGLGDPQFDVEGRAVVTRHAGFSLYNLYVPNGKRDHSRVPYKLAFYERLLGEVDAEHRAGREVVLVGDFNTAHREIDLRNPRSNQKTTGFLPEERAWIDRFLAHGLVDVYRELQPEREQYTWWTYRAGARERNVGWRLDYFLISTGLMPVVRAAEIHDQVPGSDHCPISLTIADAQESGGCA